MCGLLYTSKKSKGENNLINEKNGVIVYHAIDKNGKKVYTGITKQVLGKKSNQCVRNGRRFQRLESVSKKMLRNKARSLEEMFINNSTYNNKNIVHSINPNFKYYRHALKWAESINEIDEITNDENLLAIEYKQRYNSLSWSIKRKLKKSEESEYQLKFIKSDEKEVKEGDVFVLMPEEGIYFYGKVLEANIRNENNYFIKDQYLVTIFKCKTKNISIEDFKPDYNDLLIQPAVVSKGYWTQGIFYNVGNIPLTEEEKNLDYGLYNSIDGKFYKANGTLIERKPKIYGGYGITTGIGIAIEVEEELIIDPSLLEFK